MTQHNLLIFVPLWVQHWLNIWKSISVIQLTKELKMKHSRVISIDAEKQFDKIKHLFLGWEIPWRRTRLPTPVFLGFPGVSAGKGSAWQAGHLGSIPGLGRSPGGRHCNPLQYSCLEYPMDRGAWWAIVNRVTKSQTWWKQLSPHTYELWVSVPFTD